MKQTIWIVSYTDEKRTGIHVLEFDPATVSLRQLDALHGIEGSTYLALNRARTRLYTVCSRGAGAPRENSGAVAAYAIDGTRLTLLNLCPTPGTVPCHLSLTPDEKSLVFAEYALGHCGRVDIGANGALLPDSLTSVQHEGHGPNTARQERAHAHYAHATPDGRWVAVCDLGLDQVLLYDAATPGSPWPAEPAHIFHAAPGAGPRHLCFHPNGRLVFLLNELDSTVVSMRYDGESLSAIQTLSALPDGFTGETKAAAVKISEDGRFLVTSNRGYDSLATFAIDPDSGRMERMAISALTGPFPRDFELLPGGKFALVGHKLADEVACYAFDAASGSFTRAAATHPTYRPTCIVAD